MIMHDIEQATLVSAVTTSSRKEAKRVIQAIDAETAEIRRSAFKPHSKPDLLGTINSYFFGPAGYATQKDSASADSTSVTSVLSNRRGSCVGLAIVYLALAQRLGLDAHAVATPVHLFVRVRLPNGSRNVELMEGGQSIDDDTYRRYYRIDDPSIAAGAFMHELTNDQVIAHLLSNQAVALSKQGKLDEALARYDKALRLHPKLVAAWYNRGIDLMNAGRLGEALESFNRTIDLYPSDAQAHNNRGLTKAKLGDSDGARADFERALQLEPEMREAEENLKELLTAQ